MSPGGSPRTCSGEDVTNPLLVVEAPVRMVDELVRHLADGGRTLVALSGGVDSSLVAALAFEALGPAAFALTLTGPAVSNREVERAMQVARGIGIEHALVPVNPLTVEGYRQNPSNRCYFCRATETEALQRWAENQDIQTYVDGVHLDDLGDDRPGLKAMDEAGFEHPLVWARWRKGDVRELARRRGLPNWNQPSDACLASRIAHGNEVEEMLLRRIEAAESIVLAEGFRRVRVRVDGTRARIEVGTDEVSRLRTEPLMTRLSSALLSLGFSTVSIDPSGYRSQSGV